MHATDIHTDDGVRLRVAHGGSGPGVVLLHGFPDGAWVWDTVAARLVAADYRVVVPTQRGYAGSDAPRRVAAYHRPRLARDVLCVMDALGLARATVVGHDWGGGVAWELGYAHPERLDRLVVVNCPDPWVLRDAMVRSPAQASRSAYMAYFQLPGLPEKRLAGRVGKLRTRWGATPRHEAEATAAFATPELCRGPLNWYRAAAREVLRRRPRPKVPVPTLLVWGLGDPVLGEELIDPCLARLEHGRAVRVPEGGHWPAETKPEEVANAILGFLAAP